MKEFLTPIQAIRKKCLECCNGQKREIRECRVKTCPLYDYRISIGHHRKSNSSKQLSIDFDVVKQE